MPDEHRNKGGRDLLPQLGQDELSAIREASKRLSKSKTQL